MDIHSRREHRLEDGTAQGQILYWDNTLKQWRHVETSEVVWDDTNKRMGVGIAVPLSDMDVGDTHRCKRLLAGGVTEHAP